VLLPFEQDTARSRLSIMITMNETRTRLFILLHLLGTYSLVVQRRTTHVNERNL
jgi:hypothetical protein